MADNLLDFLAENPIDGLTEEIVLSERLKNFKFKIRAMSGKEFKEYSRQCRKMNKKGEFNFEYELFDMLVVINHTVYPEFRDVQALEKAGCQTPEQFINKSLMAGEVTELSREISRLSGFNQNINELTDEVKNS